MVTGWQLAGIRPSGEKAGVMNCQLPGIPGSPELSKGRDHPSARLSIQTSGWPRRSVTYTICRETGEQCGIISVRVLPRRVRTGPPSMGNSMTSAREALDWKASLEPSGETVTAVVERFSASTGQMAPVSTSAMTNRGIGDPYFTAATMWRESCIQPNGALPEPRAGFRNTRLAGPGGQGISQHCSPVSFGFRHASSFFPSGANAMAGRFTKFPARCPRRRWFCHPATRRDSLVPAGPSPAA